MGKIKLKKVVFATFLTVFSVVFGFRPIRTLDLIEINPSVRKFLGRKRPLKILPTTNLFLGIDLDSIMSKIDLDYFGIR